jgi:hypothetical protein
MRQTTARKQTTKSRDRPKELMVEGLTKRKIRYHMFSPNEINLIKCRRSELFKRGLTDGEIAKIIAKQLGRTTKSVSKKLYYMVKSGELGENPNKKTKRPFGFFSRMSDEELLSYAQKLVDKCRIMNKSALANSDGGLYVVLCKRKDDKGKRLIGYITFKKRYREWSSICNEELIARAQFFIDERKIINPSTLQIVDSGLHRILLKRKDGSGKPLIESIKFSKKQRRKRDWSSKSDNRLISLAQKFVDKNDLKNRAALAAADIGLYCILFSRRDRLNKQLIERIRFKKAVRRWRLMTDDQLCSFARAFIFKTSIRNKYGLYKTDSGIYTVLKKRRLLGRIKFEEKRRRAIAWKNMENEEIIELAKTFIIENGIRRRSDLLKEYKALYEVLRKRHLIHAVFADIEQSQQKMQKQQLQAGLQQAADAMEQFGDSN